MWKNPDLLFEAYDTEKIVGLFRIFGDKEFPELVEENEVKKPIYENFKFFYEQLQELYLEIKNMNRGVVISRMKFKYHELLLIFAEEIEKNFQPLIIMVMLGMTGDIRLRYYWDVEDYNVTNENSFDIAIQAFVSNTTGIVHFLQGDENTILVGGYQNNSAWLKLKKPLSTKEEIRKFPLPHEIDMLSISQDDVDLISDCFFSKKLKRKDIPQIKSFRPVIEMLEDAYANFRYLPLKEGNHVIVTGLPAIKSVILRVKEEEEGHLCLVARVNHQDGCEYFTFYDVKEVISLLRRSENDNSAHPFMIWLVVKIYHDLVTAKSIRIKTKKNISEQMLKSTKKKKDNASSYSPSFIYIPRVEKDGREEIVRVKLSRPLRDYTPRHVTAYKRRGNMSLRQKEAVREYEKMMGMSILEKLPEGHTFVRDFISPAMSKEEFENTPIYIRARIMDDFEKVIRNLED